MPISDLHDKLLQVTREPPSVFISLMFFLLCFILVFGSVVECTKLKEREWIKKHEPYVSVEYGSTRFRSRTCTVDAGKNPEFHEKFELMLVEGLREMKFVVWNSNPMTYDEFIGSGKVELKDVVSTGYQDISLPLVSKTGRYAGELKLLMRYTQANITTPTSYTAPPQSYPITYSYTNSAIPWLPPPPQLVYSSLVYQPPPPVGYPVTPYPPPPLSPSYLRPGLYGMYTQPPF